MSDTRDESYFRPDQQPDANAHGEPPAQSGPAQHVDPTAQFPPIPPQYQPGQHDAPQSQPPQTEPTQYQPPQYEPTAYQPNAYQPTTYQPGQYEQGAPTTGGPSQPGAPGYPGGPTFYGPPPKKKSRVGLIVTLSIVAVLVVCGGITAGVLVAGNHSDKTNTASTSDPQAGTSTPPVTPTPSATESDGPTHTGSLVKYLIPAPSSSRPDKHPLGTHNAFTAKQEAAQWQDGKDWRLNLLNDHSFRTGAVRQWEQPNTLVEIEIYGFENANNARGFLEDDVSNPDYYDKPTTEKSVSNVPGGQIFYTKTKDSDKNTHALAVARCGDVAIEVWVDTYGTVSLTLVNGLLYKQYKKLCP